MAIFERECGCERIQVYIDVGITNSEGDSAYAKKAERSYGKNVVRGEG